jgi:class 3 adenylate cyclase
LLLSLIIAHAPDSGAVVVGVSVGKDADVFGGTPNIAARVQAAAEPGTVVITDTTHRRLFWFCREPNGDCLKNITRLECDPLTA